MEKRESKERRRGKRPLRVNRVEECVREGECLKECGREID